MKRLDQLNMLDGQIEHISVCELRMQIGEVLRQVRMGKTFVINHRGHVVAKICHANAVDFIVPAFNNLPPVAAEPAQDTGCSAPVLRKISGAGLSNKLQKYG